MNILQAEAFSNRRGLVLDTFTFADPHRTLDLNPTEVDRLRATAERVIAGKLDVRELLRNRPKPALPSRKARIPARIAFDADASQTATLIEIVAEDRPGLLYDLASAISVERRQYRSGADRHPGAQGHRRLLRDRRRRQAERGAADRPGRSVAEINRVSGVRGVTVLGRGVRSLMKMDAGVRAASAGTWGMPAGMPAWPAESRRYEAAGDAAGAGTPDPWVSWPPIPGCYNVDNSRLRPPFWTGVGGADAKCPPTTAFAFTSKAL